MTSMAQKGGVAKTVVRSFRQLVGKGAYSVKKGGGGMETDSTF